MSVIATICARSGSVGVPGKNIKSLHGKPLICYSIEQALECEFINKVYVSTDDEEIANIAQKAGATIPFMRPKELACDETAKLHVIQHLVHELEKHGQSINVIIDLDATSPLREIQDIHNCFQLLTPMVELVITGYASNKNPYFNMVEENSNGYVSLSKMTSSKITSRQTAPKVYAMNASIYVWQRYALNKAFWDNSRIKLYEMPPERSIDIDTAVDWKLVELLMREKDICKI